MTKQEMITKIIAISKQHNYVHLKTQDWCINFEKVIDTERIVINVYWDKRLLTFVTEVNSAFKVQTTLTHPKKGRHQLNRHSINWIALSKIFHNPRVHTGLGYYIKK